MKSADITTPAQQDYYSLTIPSGTNGTMLVTVQSSGLSLLEPEVYIYDASGDQIGSAISTAYGGTITTTYSGVTAGSTYYVMASSPVSTANGTGAYALSMTFGNNPAPTVPLPNTQKLNGSPISSGGGIAVDFNTETLVNTTTVGVQTESPYNGHTMAMDASGNFVIVWESQNQDGSGWGVYAQRFAASGNKVRSEFRVNTTTASDQENPVVAMSPGGSFVVVWASGGQDGSGWGIFGQRYSSLGLPVGGEFKINTYTSNDQNDPDIAMDGNGDFVVTWASNGQDGSGWGVYAQRYNSQGTPVGRRVPRQHSDCRRPDLPKRLDGFQRRLRDRLAEPESGRQRLGRLRPAVQSTGHPGRGRIPCQHNHQWRPDQPQRGHGWHGEFHGRLVEQQSKRHRPRCLRPAVQQSGRGPGRRVPGQYDHRRHPDASQRGDGPGRRYPLYLVEQFHPGSAQWNVLGRQFNLSGVALGPDFQVNTSVGFNQMYSNVAMNNQGQVAVDWAGGSTLDGAGIYMQQFTISFIGLESPASDTLMPGAAHAGRHSRHEHHPLLHQPKLKRSMPTKLHSSSKAQGPLHEPRAQEANQNGSANHGKVVQAETQATHPWSDTESRFRFPGRSVTHARAAKRIMGAASGTSVPA